MALVFTPVYDTTATITDLATGWNNPAVIDSFFDEGWEIFSSAKAAPKLRLDTSSYGGIVRNTGTYTQYQYVEFTIGALLDEMGSGAGENEISGMLHFVSGVGGYLVLARGTSNLGKFDIVRIDGETYSAPLATTGTGSSFAPGTKIRGYRSPIDGKLYLAADTGSGFSVVISATDTTYTAGRPGMQGYIDKDQNEGYVTRIVTGNVTDGGGKPWRHYANMMGS